MRGSQGYLSTVIIAFLALLLSCGQDVSHENGSSASITPSVVNSHFDLNTALAEIGSYSAPPEVDAAVFAQLKSALSDALVARSKGKLVSSPPSGTANAVPDLEISDAGGGTVNLTWHYYNTGDYNQDGIVNVSDITPLAIHYNEAVTSNPGDENLLLSVINGGGGTKIGIDDVTPIAMYFGSEVANYRIETSPTPGGAYTPVQPVAFSTAQDAGTARAHFTANFAPTWANWYRVVPVDSSDAAGAGSNEVLAVAPVWVHTWGLSGSDETRGVAFDESGNLYVVGSTNSSGAGDYDVLLLKYTPYGDFVWARTWGGANKDDGRSICYDSTSQSLIILGQTQSFGAGQSDLLLLRYSTEGDLQWQRAWGGPANEWASRVTTNGGDVYVCAATNSYGAGDFDALIMKVSQFGAVTWVRTWGGADYDVGTGISLDSSGNPWIAGLTQSYGVGNGDVFLLKYDTSGNALSQRTWGTPNFEGAIDVTHDNDDNLLICGTELIPSQEAFTMKLTSVGDFAWAKALIGANIEANIEIVTDAYGNSQVCGTTNSTSFGGLDVFFAAYNSLGSLIALNAWGTPLEDQAFGVALGSDGYLYCSGLASSAFGVWGTPPFTEEEITTGTLSDAAGTETTPAELMIDVVGVVQAPVGEILDAGAGDKDALIMKVLLLS